MNHQKCLSVISMLWNLQIRILYFHRYRGNRYSVNLQIERFSLWRNLLNKNSRTLIKYNADKRNGSSDGESTPGHYEGGAFGQNISKIGIFIKPHIRKCLENEKWINKNTFLQFSFDGAFKKEFSSLKTVWRTQ